MDASHVRALIEGALEAQRVRVAAEANLRAATEARNRAVERHVREAQALEAVIGNGLVIYGDVAVRVGLNTSLACTAVLTAPVTQIPVVLPPSPPADPPVDRRALTVQDFADTPINKPDPPKLSGGTIPPAKKSGK